MEIARASRADVEQLIRLRFAFLQEFRQITDETRVRLEPELRRYFTKHLGADDFVALLGMVAGEAACTAFFTVGESPPNDQYPNGRIAYVFNVFTCPAHRGRGYAMLLMQRLVAAARAMDVTAINLNASAAGRPLYEKLGFAVLTDTAMRMQLHGTV